MTNCQVKLADADKLHAAHILCRVSNAAFVRKQVREFLQTGLHINLSGKHSADNSTTNPLTYYLRARMRKHCLP